MKSFIKSLIKSKFVRLALVAVISDAVQEKLLSSDDPKKVAAGGVVMMYVEDLIPA